MRPTPEELSDAIVASGGRRYLAALLPMAMPAIEITPEPTDDGAIAIGASKFGGDADLPRSADWPVSGEAPMNFLAQINLADLPPCDDESELPPTGLLSFFYRVADGVWGFDPADRSGFHVHFTPTGTPLERRAAPTETDAEDNPMAFRPCSLSYKVVASLPSPDAVPDYAGAPDADEWFAFIEENEALAARLWGNQGADGTCLNQMLGRPFTVQSPFVLVEAAAIAKGLNLGGEIPEEHEQTWNDAMAEQTDWVVLLQLDTDDRPQWMWGDMGMLYFLVRKDHARSGDFSRVWCILQCG